ncbi:hypothetical protein [Mucilaginibacter sp. PAMB04168]|uniref:hypothetical protein n=1 Tax=Mucilaginibacter sp. PAMB04168 TaxID=3138567 RepID=UPI0031F660DC
MRSKTLEIYEINSDIIGLMVAINEIGWPEIREQSVHRILYLSSVLYAFIYSKNDGNFNNYHFSITDSGPFSSVINKSLLDLRVRELLLEDEHGNFKINTIRLKEESLPQSDKLEWFRIVIYILGKYGESKVFGFVIQDPQYKEFFQRNSQKEIDISDQNRTTKTLNKFKKTFEESIENVSQINQKEYLELYFEYIFSKIIRKES